MKKTFCMFAVLLFAFSLVAQAETDPNARKWIQMMLDGSEGSYKGVTTGFKSLRTIGPGKTTSGVGTAHGALTKIEYGDSLSHQTVLTATSLAFPMVEGGTGTNGFGSVNLYDFPAGRILVEGVTVKNFTVAVDTNALDNADGGDFAFGSAAAGGASGLAGTEVNFIPSTSIDAITNVVSAALAASAQLDGTTTPIVLYANMEVDDADIAAGATNLVSFAITITWKNLGDY